MDLMHRATDPDLNAVARREGLGEPRVVSMPRGTRGERGGENQREASDQANP